MQSLRLTQLTQNLGAEVRGVDCSKALDESTIHGLRDALHANGLRVLDHIKVQQ